MSSRNACYREIRAVVKTSLDTYAQEHPEWMVDERAANGRETFLHIMRGIFDVLDRYAIEAKSS